MTDVLDPNSLTTDEAERLTIWLQGTLGIKIKECKVLTLYFNITLSANSNWYFGDAGAVVLK